MKKMLRQSVSRRQALAFGAVGGLLLAMPGRAVAGRTEPGDRVLRFHNLHTGEDLSATYMSEGRLVDDECAAIDNVLRDWRTDDVAAIDRGVFDFMYELRQAMGSDEPFDIISGYRSPATNNMLANRNGGVARRSLHMRGMAVDLALPGRDLWQLRQAALDLGKGGVGYYPRSGFIHIDTGRVRFW